MPPYQGVTVSRPVGGILSGPRLDERQKAWVAIHLSGLPGEPSLSGGGRAAHFPRLALLRVGFTEPAGSPPPLVRSYRTLSPLPVRTLGPAIGGFLSVALSCGSPRLAVSQHPALRSPDLPQHGAARYGPCCGHLADSPSSSSLPSPGPAPSTPCRRRGADGRRRHRPLDSARRQRQASGSQSQVVLPPAWPRRHDDRHGRIRG